MSDQAITKASAATWLGTIGINTHVGTGGGAYNNAAAITRSLDYLGIGTVRDAFTASDGTGALIGSLADAGVKFDFVAGTSVAAKGSAGIQAFVDGIGALQSAKPGSVYAVEGLNEVNTQPFSFNGSSSVSAAADFQRALYTTVRADSTLSGVAVINTSVAMESTSAYAELGDLGAYSDYGNAHAYTNIATRPDAEMEASMARAAGASAGDPVVITETGYTTWADHHTLGVDESSQAKLTLTGLLDAFEDGSAKTFLYELFDSSLDASSPEQERHFGLFNADGTPKQAATAVHNLTAILSYDDTAPGASSAAVSLSSLPSDGHATILDKANGGFDVVVWRDTQLWSSSKSAFVPVTSASTVVDLGSVQSTVYVYDPLQGTTPVAVYHDVSKVTLAVSDHPLIVEVGSKSPVTDTVTAVAPNLVTTSTQFVARLDQLAKASGLVSVTLDSNVLRVPTVATMNDLIAHYGGVLGKVAGGYSFVVATQGEGWRCEVAYDAAGVKRSTTDYIVNAGAVQSSHTVRADGSVFDQSFAGGKLASSVEVAADGTRTSLRYDGVSGLTAQRIVVGADKVTTAETSTAGAVAKREVTAADGSKTVTNFDAQGRKTSLVAINTANVWTTTNYDASSGATVSQFVSRPDGSSENDTYGITGQSYASQHQVVDARGKVTLVERKHADGTMASVEANNADGSRLLTAFDDKGRKTSVLQIGTDGSQTNQLFDAATGTVSQQAVVRADKSSVTTVYSGSTTTVTTVYADRSRMVQGTAGKARSTDTFNAAGVRTSSVNVDALGAWSTMLFDASSGAMTRKYITNADGSMENWQFGITGQDFVNQVQKTDTAGRVVTVQRTHADNSLAYTEFNNADGSRQLGYYNSKGALQTLAVIGKDGTRTTTNYNVATGAVAQQVVQSPNLDVVTTLYTAGIRTSQATARGDGSKVVKTFADGAQQTDTYGTNGIKTSSVVVDASNTWTTTQYNTTSGAMTARYVTRADGSSENFAYGIAGQAYTTQHQAVNAKRQVTLLERSRADGTLVYSETTNPDGSRALVDYDGKGAKFGETLVAANGTRTLNYYDAASGVLIGTAGANTAAADAGSVYASIQYDNGTRRETGSGGRDLMIGRSSATLTGGAGDDTFRVEAGAGSVTITDFGAGHDLLDIGAFTRSGYAPTIALKNGNTVLSFGTGDTVTLVGVSTSHLASAGTSGNFTFA